MRPRSPSPKGGGAPQFSAHVYYGQTVGWMKLVLGMEVGLGPGDFVLAGDPAPLLQKGAEPPSSIFGPFLLWPNGWMDQYGTWHGASPRPRRLCVRWGPSCRVPKKGGVVPLFCTVVIGKPIFKFKFYCSMHSIFRKKG